MNIFFLLRQYFIAPTLYDESVKFGMMIKFLVVNISG